MNEHNAEPACTYPHCNCKLPEGCDWKTAAAPKAAPVKPEAVPAATDPLYHKKGWECEAADLDALLHLFGLNPRECRTEGGNLKLAMVRERIAALPEFAEHMAQGAEELLEALASEDFELHRDDESTQGETPEDRHDRIWQETEKRFARDGALRHLIYDFRKCRAALSTQEAELRTQIRQADERGDEAMRRAHAWEKVACESGDWLPDSDGFPRPTASRARATTAGRLRHRPKGLTMTVMTGDDPALPEELDEQTEMEMLRQEVYESMCRVQEYRAGNTELLEALMRLAEQHGTPLEQSARDHAQKVLFDAGMVNGHDGTLNWEALRERKDNRWTWEHCVRTLVKQPAEVERLLALSDEPPQGGSEGGS